jgi:hypothetical protein
MLFKSFLWWVLEMFIGFVIFYIIIYSVKNPVNIGWVSFILVVVVSFGVFASPMTRHLSFWNKVIDKMVEKEEEKTKF